MSLFSASPSVLVSALAAVLCVCAPAAHAQTFSNTAAIAIPNGGPATPYPSTINVVGAPTSIGYLSVTLSGFSHTFVSDVNVLLVSPTGEKILLMANCNGDDIARGTADNATLTFIPDGAVTLPNAGVHVVSGVYACSVYVPPAALPVPAPAGPYGTSLAPLIGTDANGAWNLYVWDDYDGDNGTFAGGWSIGFSSTPPAPMATAFTYQGLLSAGGTPITGNANVRFTLCNSETVPTTISAVASPITQSFTGVNGGLITTTLDFGTAIDANQSRWLNIEIESPPGSGFVTLAPRQPIMPTPQARVAQSAQVAANVPWSGITGVPPNVSGAFSPWTDEPPVGITTSRRVGVGIQSGALGNHQLSVAGSSVFLGAVDIGANIGGIGVLHVAGSAGILGALNVGNTAVPPVFTLNVYGEAGKLGGGAWSVLSDPRAKHDIAPLSGTLDKLLNLRGYSFVYNDDRIAAGFALPGTQFGLMADEVARVFPDWVSTDATGTRYVTERATTALMVEALRDLRAEKDAVAAKALAAQQQIDGLKADGARRDAENSELKARLERLEETLKALTAGK